MGFENWTNAMPNDGRDIDPSLRTAHEHEPLVPNTPCPDINLPSHLIEGIEITADSWENQSRHSRISAGSDIGSQYATNMPRGDSSTDIFARFDPTASSDLALPLSTDMETHLYVRYLFDRIFTDDAIASLCISRISNRSIRFSKRPPFMTIINIKGYLWPCYMLCSHCRLDTLQTTRFSTRHEATPALQEMSLLAELEWQMQIMKMAIILSRSMT